MNTAFQRVPRADIKRSKFDLSHENKLTLKLGTLTPVLSKEMVPGDSFKCNVDTLVRMHPALAPVMQRLNCYIHFFAVPERLAFRDFDKFITRGDTGSSEVVSLPYTSLRGIVDRLATDVPTPPAEYVAPTGIRSADFAYTTVLWSRFADMLYYGSVNELLDGITITTTDNIKNVEDLYDIIVANWQNPEFFSAAEFRIQPFIMNYLIWREYYRDQDLQSIDSVSTFYGQMDENIEFFINMLPTDNVFTNGVSGLAALLNIMSLPQQRLYEDDYFTMARPYAQKGTAVTIPGNSTVQEHRSAFALQQVKEILLKAGSRYVEYVKALFGTDVPDARSQRPEFIGSYKTTIKMSEVLQTSETSEDSPLGDMGGHGIAVGGNGGFYYEAKEHCIIFGIMSVVPRIGYMDYRSRMFYRNSPFQFLTPQYATIGEQEIYVKEIGHSALSAAEPEDEFGYQERYAEYKSAVSTVHGDMKGNLAYWHMDRGYWSTDSPTLSEAFVKVNPVDLNRVFPVISGDSGDKLYAQIYFDITAIRPLPKIGTVGGLIDHAR